MRLTSATNYLRCHIGAYAAWIALLLGHSALGSLSGYLATHEMRCFNYLVDIAQTIKLKRVFISLAFASAILGD